MPVLVGVRGVAFPYGVSEPEFLIDLRFRPFRALKPKSREARPLVVGSVSTLCTGDILSFARALPCLRMLVRLAV